jgi:hypothetical protein
MGPPIAPLPTPQPIAPAPIVAPAPIAPVTAPVAPVAPVAPAPVPGVLEVRCPSCQMMTMLTPGQGSVCFSCGQPLPANLGAAAPAAYPLTGAVAAADPLRPPPSPYGVPVCAVVSGPSGSYTVRAGAEVRVGRDPSQCAVLLHEPRVSGVHATLKWDNAQLWVRDEQSNNGTFVDGGRVPAAVWTPIRAGATLRFGPIEMGVRFE